ncbi:hypothetical protein PR202_ga11958 [Eleusine coracana subsp. coracana]|uniref:Serine/threonine-protein kinase BSK1-like TPR repeats domain-containing protein n=1 Tax=Eleusine coracana subsp. coracana TaxID=191504 RepID=A0AAV5CAA5_ELECO|nr:hypothetical protein PR202_ga11958 [Eleusine coracana subsp. coracana]
MAVNAGAIDDALQTALDGNLRRLKKKAKEVDLREAKDAKGRNALHFAAAKGRLGTCEFLVQEIGLGVNSLSGDGETPMLLAASQGKLAVLTYLLDRGGDPAKPDSGGVTPLHESAENGHTEAVRLLLSKGIDVDPINYRGTPLHLAASKDREEVVKILLEHGADGGADVNYKTPHGPTTLMMAVDDGLADIVKFLLEAGADPNIPDVFSISETWCRFWFFFTMHRGKIPIMYAAARKQHGIVENLFAKTKPVSSVPDWSIDGVISAMEHMCLEKNDYCLQMTYSVKEQIAYLKSHAKEAFGKRDYLEAIYFYTQAIEEKRDATLFANRSLCWLQMGEGDRALLDAQQCKKMRPHWSMAWYREGTALRLPKNYRGAGDAFVQALKRDPESEMIKKALTETMDALKNVASTGGHGQNPGSDEPAKTVDISQNDNAPQKSTKHSTTNSIEETKPNI